MVLFFFLAFFISLLFSYPSHAMLISGETVVSPDKSRYITLLGHLHEGGFSHEDVGWDVEEQQMDALINICKEGIKEGKKFHILFEKASDAVRAFSKPKSMLGGIEEAFAQAELAECTIENIEIRDVGMAAGMLFEAKGRVIAPELRWNETSKPLKELTFQDMFDEFETYAGELEPFAQKLVAANPDCPNAVLINYKYTGAREYIVKIKQFLKENNFLAHSKILEIAQQRTEDCPGLCWTTDHAFSDLFDLQILRRVLQLNFDVQLIVIAGGAHTLQTSQFLNDIKWQTRIYDGDIFAEIPKPLTYQNIRSFVLNETKWDKKFKDMFKYLAFLKVTLNDQILAIYNTIP